MRADAQKLRGAREVRRAARGGDELAHDVHPLAGHLVVEADVVAGLAPVDRDHGLAPRRRRTQSVPLWPSHGEAR